MHRRGMIALWMSLAFTTFLHSGCRRERRDKEISSPPPRIVRHVGSMTDARRFRFLGLHQNRWELLSAQTWLERIGDTLAIWIDPVFRKAIADNDSLWVLWNVQNLSDTVEYPPMPWEDDEGCMGGAELPMGVSFVPAARDSWGGGVDVSVQVRFYQEGQWSPWQTAQPAGFLDILPPGCGLGRSFPVAPSSVCRYVFKPERGESLQIRTVFQAELPRKVGLFLYRPAWLFRTLGNPWVSLQMDTFPVPGGQNALNLPVTLRFSLTPCTETLEVRLRLYRRDQMVAARTHTFWPPWIRDTVPGIILDTFTLPGGGEYRVEGEILGHTFAWRFHRKSGTFTPVETLGVFQIPLPDTTFTPVQLMRRRVAWTRGLPLDSLEWWEWDRITGEVQHVVTLYTESLGLDGILMVVRDEETGWFVVGGNARSSQTSRYHIVLVDPQGRPADRVGVDTLSFPYREGWGEACGKRFEPLFDLPGPMRWGTVAVHCSIWNPLIPWFEMEKILVAAITWGGGFAWDSLEWYPLGEVGWISNAWDSTTRTFLSLKGGGFWSVWPPAPGFTDTTWLYGARADGALWTLFWVVPPSIPPVCLRAEGGGFWEVLHAHNSRRKEIWIVRYRSYS